MNRKLTGLLVKLNLRLFDGEGATGGDSAAGAATQGAAATDTGEGVPKPKGRSRSARNPLANVVYGKAGESAKEGADAQAQQPVQQTSTVQIAPEARKAEFERLIATEFKDLFGERVQAIVDGRFKQTKTLESQVKALDPVLQMLGSKYGVDPKNAEALAKAIEEDSSYYEEEAMERGLTVEQLKDIKKLEREVESFRRMQQDQQKQQEADKTILEWRNQEVELKKVYPQFDLIAEIDHPETGDMFRRLIENNVPVRTAYEVAHRDAVLGGVAQYTAQQVAQQVQESIRVQGLRPVENGVTSGAAAMIVKRDPSSLTRKDREEISKRVLAGKERIEF